jgi:hypothetical protein
MVFKPKQKQEEQVTDEENEQEEVPTPVKKEKAVRFQVGAVAVQTEPVIVDAKTEEQYNIYTALAKIMNDIEELKKAISG